MAKKTKLVSDEPTVRVKLNMGDYPGRRARVLGPPQVVSGTSWTPVLWADGPQGELGEGEDDPDFYKTGGLEPIPEGREPRGPIFMGNGPASEAECRWLRRRVNEALSDLSGLQQCANASPDEIREVTQSIEDAVRDIAAAFGVRIKVGEPRRLRVGEKQ